MKETSPIWANIRRWFKDSEVIFLARLQVFLGALAMIITYIDPSIISPVLPNGWAPWFIILHGFAMEFLRRRRDDRMKDGQ